MPHVIRCENCQAQLRLPDDFVGKEVRCPSCQKVFMAREDMETRPQPPTPRPEPPADEPGIRVQPGSERRRPRRHEEDDEDYPRNRRPRYDDDDAYRTRRFAQGDRSGVVLTLGIIALVASVLTLCFSLLGVVGFALGLTATIMGRNDLAAIKRGERDPAGEGRTRSGMICGLIGLILGSLFLLLGCVFILVMVLNGK